MLPAVLIVIGAVAAAAGLAIRRPAPGRTFTFRYTASFEQLPRTARDVRVWIPLAKTRGNQQVLSRRIRTSLPYEVHEDPIFGNDLLYLEAPRSQLADIVIEYTAAVSRAPHRGWERPSGAVASAQESSVNLRDEPLMVVNREVTRRAEAAVAGRRTERDKAHALYEAVLAGMRYDKATPGWGRGDTLRACRLGVGNCTDFHALLISMSRAVGIPARFAIGVTLSPQPGAIAGYHCWAELSVAGRWMQVDASEAWKHPEQREQYFGGWDPDKFLISMGRNLELVPAQAGPPVNYLVHPYVEADGVPVEGLTAVFERVS